MYMGSRCSVTGRWQNGNSRRKMHIHPSATKMSLSQGPSGYWANRRRKRDSLPPKCWEGSSCPLETLATLHPVPCAQAAKCTAPQLALHPGCQVHSQAPGWRSSQSFLLLRIPCCFLLFPRAHPIVPVMHMLLIRWKTVGSLELFCW
jgi:hypothetical protein